ncbi:MFS transporter [Sinomonas susongensis]|uniref:MFS transporter n=1 Tax=Sinomonas susongensis TaxID=1324851 RepID=UPI001107FFD3|nr:MFS transporter [Sinomonas susongensis]
MRRPWLRASSALFAIAWGGNHFTPLLHLYEVNFHYSVLAVDVFLGTYVAGLVPGLLLGGALSDRHGRRPLVLAGVLLSAAASIVLAVGSASAVAMCGGRFLAGASVGVAMSVGTSWVKELSGPRFDPTLAPEGSSAAGARRPALALTLGFGLGAGVAGSLAQWGPLPSVLPYAVHVVLALASLALVASVPETKSAGGSRSSRGLWDDLRVPLVGHERFVRVVVPGAPWIFATAGIGYAVIPLLEAPVVGRWALAYATGLTVLTLGVGAVVQPFVPRINALTHGRAGVAGLAAMLVGLLAAAGNAVVLSPWLGALAAAILGAAYGTCLVSGLGEVQSIAGPDDLAGLTGVYYSLSYLGFLLPIVLAGLAGFAPYAVLLLVVAAVCLACLVAVARGIRSTAA